MKCQCLILTHADAPSIPTGIVLSEKTYDSEFANATLSWNKPTGRVDAYIVNTSTGLSNLQQFNVTTSNLKLDKIQYNINITVNISAVNCVAESERARFSFILSKYPTLFCACK